MIKFIKYLPKLFRVLPRLNKIGELFKGENGMDIKAGIKTTEFWGKLIVQVLAIVGMLGDVINVETAAIIVAVLEGVYNIMRGILKAKGKELPALPVKQ